MRRPITVHFCLLVAVLLAGTSSALALSIGPPRSYVRASEDGQYLFVMLADNERRIGETGDQASSPASRYKQSEMYRNDGSTSALWTVDWYARHVIVGSDGQHVISFVGAGLPYTYSIEFHSNAQLLRRHIQPELVRYHWLLPNVWLTDVDLYDDTLVIRTHHGDVHTFDITTGQIIGSDWKFPRQLQRLTDVSMGAFAAVTTTYLLRRRRSANRAATQVDGAG